MKLKALPVLLAAALALTSTSCGNNNVTPTATSPANEVGHTTTLVLSDSGTTVDGSPASTSPSDAVYTGADIIYYEDGQDETYGEGTEQDAHTVQEAAAQTVVTITRPGTYRVSGTLSAGQLSIDLGEDASTDPAAVVTLILDGVDITCTVAPAVIFYNVYECGSSDAQQASSTVDTTNAGANVILADGSENTVTGSYVAKIYQKGTDKKLHKYDAAFYSKMSMNINGESDGTGLLHIQADNEGLDSELHLTINGGKLSIQAQNDGINTNEDGVSVTTVNGGELFLNAGLGAEGDGIDSNGWVVINGGNVVSLANGRSGDGGLDADQGIVLNGGNILALGSRNDAIDSSSTQSSLAWSLADTHESGSILVVTDAQGKELLSYTTEKEYSAFVFSTPDLTTDGTYTVTIDGDVQQNAQKGGPGGGGPGNGQRPEGQSPEAGEPPAELDGNSRSERSEPPQSLGGQPSQKGSDSTTPIPTVSQEPN